MSVGRDLGQDLFFLVLKASDVSFVESPRDHIVELDKDDANPSDTHEAQWSEANQEKQDHLGLL